MKIAIFTEVFLPKIDGITNRVANTVKELLDSGHEVLLFVPKGSVENYLSAQVIPIDGIPFKPYPQVKLLYPSPKILSNLLSFSPDVAHIVGPATLGVWGTIACRMMGIPLVSSYHTDIPGYAPMFGFHKAQRLLWKMIRAVHNRALTNLCPSRYTQAELRENGVKNVEIWRGGVNTELFSPLKRSDAMRQRLTAGNSDKKLAIYVGRLSYEKSIDTFLPVLQKNPNLRFAVVGDGPAKSQLESIYRDYPVEFTGFLKGEELAQAYASADLFFMPSRTETLGFVSLEAMCSGLPIVAVNRGGNRDVVSHEENGFLYDPNSKQELLECFDRLLNDKDTLARLTRGAMNARDTCSWYQETANLTNIYRKTIKKHFEVRIFAKHLRPLLA